MRKFIIFDILNGGEGDRGVGDVVWVDEVFTGTLVLLTRQHSIEKHVLLPRHHVEEAQSAGYI